MWNQDLMQSKVLLLSDPVDNVIHEIIVGNIYISDSQALMYIPLVEVPSNCFGSLKTFWLGLVQI